MRSSSPISILQYAALALGWNVLGGYAGFVNFGAAAFFAAGAYGSVALSKLTGAPVTICIALGAAIGAALGLAMGALTFGSEASISPSRRFRWPSCCKHWSSTGGSSAAPPAPI